MTHHTCRKAGFILLALATCLVAVRADAGSGTDEVLWYNSATYDFAVWTMNGAALVQSAIVAHLQSTLGWQFKGLGDIDGNGTGDVVWFNSTTGDVVIWFMEGGRLSLSAVVAGVLPALGWNIVGVGDFDGDGKADLLWRNSLNGDVGMWLMDGQKIVSTHLVAVAVPTVWAFSPIGIGDFDGDGDDDILWIHSLTNDAALWLTNGPTITQAGVLVPSLAAGWATRGVADFNNDGIDDVLWRNTISGDVAVWLMNGTSLPQGVVVLAAGATTWLITGVGDFDGDGDPDILWRSGFTGDVAVWIMDGRTLVGGFIVVNVLLTSQWHTIGVADFDGAGDASP